MRSRFHQTVATISRFLRQNPLGHVVACVLSVTLWVAVWHVAAMQIGKPLLLPSPLAVAQRIVHLAETTSFWRYSLLSLVRVLGGIVLGISLGALVAILTAVSPLIKTLLSPLITTVKTTPVASFIILAMLWINEGMLPVFISFLIVFPVVWSNLHTALSSIPTPYHELGRVFRLPLGRRIRRIYIPSALPYFLSACRSCLGLAWKAGIAAEAIALPALSIGKQLMDAKIYLETIDLFAWTAVVIVLSLVLEFVAELIFRPLQRRTAYVSRWGENDNTRG